MRKWNNVVSILGITTCLVGSYFMAFGEPIIGVDHSGIATIVVITGIGLIGTGNQLSILEIKKKEESKK